MKKLLLLILIMGCEGNPFGSMEDKLSSIVFELENEVDENGYIHILADRNRFQTTYRISGHLYRDNEPMNTARMGWFSETHWLYEEYEIPIVNSASYSREDGEVNTMMAILNSMIGDTIVVLYVIIDDWKGEETDGEIHCIIY